MEEIDISKCVECGSNNWETNHDASVSCIECGLVREEMILDHRPSVSYSDDGKSNEHHGRPTNEFEHESMTTEISPAYKGGDGFKSFFQRASKMGSFAILG